MHVKLVTNGIEIPYPDAVIRGRLRLSGVSPVDIETIIGTMKEKNETGIVDELRLSNQAMPLVRRMKPRDCLAKFRTVMDYYRLRTTREDIPPIIVVLEGASATGKSMLSLEVVQDLAATRILSTDSVRQILRSVMSEEDMPELYCHTYQAYTKRQSGPADLDPVVRGFLAQTNLIQPHIVDAVSRVSREGADALIEGVHIVPGALGEKRLDALEVLVNPPTELHRQMFLGKSRNSGLKTVTRNEDIREREWQSARAIQGYMVQRATITGVPIIDMRDYETALNGVRQLILSGMRSALSAHS